MELSRQPLCQLSNDIGRSRTFTHPGIPSANYVVSEPQQRSPSGFKHAPGLTGKRTAGAAGVPMSKEGFESSFRWPMASCSTLNYLLALDGVHNAPPTRISPEGIEPCELFLALALRAAAMFEVE
jgi:hypothetical protein